MKRVLFIIALSVSLSGCDLFETPEWHHVVKEVNKVDHFVIDNGERGVLVRFLIEGELSDSAKLQWSVDSTFRDSLDSYYTIKLPKGKVNVISGPHDYYGTKMYLRYIPINPLTDGKLLIRTRI